MFTRFILIFFSFVFLIKTSNAGTLTDLLLTDTVKSLDPAQRAAQGGIGVSLWVILFYIFYLGTIWSFNAAMLITENQLAPQRRKFAKYFCRANIFLAAGDTAMFIAFLVAYLFPDAFATPEGSQKLMQLLLLGVFTTSLTMSVYYAYIGFYYRERFAGGAWDLVLLLVLVFFVIRLVLHYNPENVWFSMTLPPGQPNYSSWLRNTPLFIYGLGIVLVVLYLTWKELRGVQERLNKVIDLCIIGAMCALLFSFAMYALDVFYSHKIPHAYIWIIYTLKTLAYMVAFFLMWLGEFYFGRRLAT
ncbi:hypothetical protein [Bradyrhizobium sp.]